MTRGPGDPELLAHIESVADRHDTDIDRLIASILVHCWPGGTGDRTQAVALEWIRRWGPHAAAPPRPACTCAGGRCTLCN